MKIGIVCADEVRYRRIVRALKRGNFTKITPERSLQLDVVLTEEEIAGPADTHPCMFTRGPGSELEVQCGRHKEMQRRADAGIHSCGTLTMIFQENAEPSKTAGPVDPALEPFRFCRST